MASLFWDDYDICPRSPESSNSSSHTSVATDDGDLFSTAPIPELMQPTRSPPATPQRQSMEQVRTSIFDMWPDKLIVCLLAVPLIAGVTTYIVNTYIIKK